MPLPESDVFKKDLVTRKMFDTEASKKFVASCAAKPGIVADKHSAGGVAGTRTTMIVVPIIFFSLVGGAAAFASYIVT